MATLSHGGALGVRAGRSTGSEGGARTAHEEDEAEGVGGGDYAELVGHEAEGRVGEVRREDRLERRDRHDVRQLADERGRGGEDFEDGHEAEHLGGAAAKGRAQLGEPRSLSTLSAHWRLAAEGVASAIAGVRGGGRLAAAGLPVGTQHFAVGQELRDDPDGQKKEPRAHDER